jgi:hypothetical protein
VASARWSNGGTPQPEIGDPLVSPRRTTGSPPPTTKETLMGNDWNLDFNPDVGLSLHEWESEWESIEPDLEEEPREALREAVDLLQRMAREIHVPIRPTEQPLTEEVPVSLATITDVADRLDRVDEDVSNEEVTEAVELAREVFAFLAANHRPHDDLSDEPEDEEEATGEE